jgi:hypothetical protein
VDAIMSKFVEALRLLAPQPDRAAIGTVIGYRANGLYRVRLGAQEYDVPAAGDAQAMDKQAVAVLVSGETGKPIAMLGVVRQSGV